MATSAIGKQSAVEEFVSKLRDRMTKLDVKPMELAKVAGVGFPYLYRVLKGDQAPSLDWAAKVGRHVGLEIKVVDATRPSRKPRRSA